MTPIEVITGGGTGGLRGLQPPNHGARGAEVSFSPPNREAFKPTRAAIMPAYQVTVQRVHTSSDVKSGPAEKKSFSSFHKSLVMILSMEKDVSILTHFIKDFIVLITRCMKILRYP